MQKQEESKGYFENPYLDNEKKFTKALGEEKQLTLIEEISRAEYALNRPINEGDSEAQLFASFVKEKTALLGYVNSIVQFAGHCNGIDVSAYTKGELTIKSERDAVLQSHRISYIVRLY